MIGVGPTTAEKINHGLLRGYSIDGSATVRDDEDDSLIEVSISDLVQAAVNGVEDALAAKPPAPHSPERYRLGR